jgi:hypothetical protein
MSKANGQQNNNFFETMHMNNKLHILAGIISLVIFCNADLSAQNVAINSTGAAPNASAMLDVSSTTMGFLMPRMTTAQRTAIAAPATGLKVYDTTTGSFWYFNGTIWVQVGTAGGSWLLTGNTLAGTEFIGSLNAQPFVVRTNNVERMRVLATGQVGIATTTPGYSLTVAGTGDVFAVDNQASFTARNAASAYETFMWPRWSDNIMYINYGQNGFNIRNSASVSTMFMTAGNFVGIGTTAPANRLHVVNSVAGAATTYSSNATASGMGLQGINLAAASLTNGGVGVFGVTNQASNNQNPSAGVLAKNNNNQSVGVTGGTAVIGAGCNQIYNYLLQGQGGAFTGYNYGSYHQNISFLAGIQQAAGVFVDGGNAQLYVNMWTAGNAHYKILAGGPWAVSCSVPDTSGNMVVMHCPETPEFYFEDYGQGQLVNGRAHIDIDPILVKNVVISDKHPLRVFIQLENNEQCMGVIVKNKTGTGFDVVELGGGTSNTPFMWHIVCNVADHEENGRINHTADLRFEPSPVPVPTAVTTENK